MCITFDKDCPITPIRDDEFVPFCSEASWPGVLFFLTKHLNI
jgi:hypothetical protein